MADVEITAASVVKGSDAVTGEGILGVAATAGQAVYKDASDADKLRLADANAATPANAVKGILLNGGGIGQTAEYQTSGRLTIGGTLVKGKPYFLSATAGGICPWEDLESGCKVIELGIATTTGEIDVRLFDPGVTL